ncbi:MAG: hypothetical protein F9K49_03870 [Caedimonadaceae bacterium]|nr:MAG: hypothetical protein F9K49_03870 [Caedimonadaceae bacterium]
MKIVDIKNYGWFWIRMTVRLLSLVSAFFTTKWLSLTYGLYAYFVTSVVLDVWFFKTMRLKESNFKSPGYFKHKFQSTPAHYDRYVSSVINAKIVTFLLAHLIFLIPGFKFPIEAINILFIFSVTVIVFRYGFKFGYHQLKEVREEEVTNYIPKQPERRTGYGLPGYVAGVYTGDSRDIGT